MKFSDYKTRYENVELARNDGVLEIQMHTDGKEALWGTTDRDLHAELSHLFSDIARDEENRVIIITGTGDSFITSMNRERKPAEKSAVEYFARIYREAVALLENLLAIPVPVIGAVNGPALIHAELALFSDIVLAADHAEFADIAHVTAGVVPGDGVQCIWPMLLGPNRARYFLLTGQRISAREALTLGLVSEVMPLPDLLPRARELATLLLKNSPIMLRHTRMVFTRPFRKKLREDLELGLASEMLALLERGEIVGFKS